MDIRPVELEDFKGLLQSPYLGLFFEVPDDVLNKWVKSDDCLVQRFQPKNPLFAQGQSAETVPLSVVMEGGLFAVQHVYMVPQKNGEMKEANLIVAFDTGGTAIGESEPALRGVPNEFFMRGGPTGRTVSKVIAVVESYALQVTGPTKAEILSHPQVSLNLQRLYALKILRRSARSNAIELFKDLEVVLPALFYRLARPTTLGGVGTSEVPKDSKLENPNDYSLLNCKLNEETLALAVGKDRTAVSSAISRLREDNGIIQYRSKGTIYIRKDFLSAPPPYGLMW